MMNYQEQLDAIRIQAESEVEKIRDEIREKLVIPYCKKHGLRFTAGMGSWSFDDGFGFYINDFNNLEYLSDSVKDALTLEDITSNNELGAIMLDYVPKNYKTIRRECYLSINDDEEIFDHSKLEELKQ